MMEAKKRQPSIAKISPPRLASVFPRARLFRLLDSARENPVVWVSAPAGSGKTTLVASWLDVRKLPCIWYQLDEGDKDPATFFYYLGLAAKKAAPRYKKPLPLLTPEYLATIKIFARRYFENLCSRLKTPFILVFDNYHEVAQESPFHEIFREGLSAVPAGVRVVVVSRQDPPSPYASFQAGNRLGLIGRDDLMLTAEESTGLIHATGGKKLLRETINRMHDKAHGWAAGIILLSKGAQVGKGLLPDDPGKRTPEEVFDYFASELFDRAEPKIRDFLLKTAFLPTITPDAAEMLTGSREADRILAGLHHGNYFTEKRFKPEIVYQYHPLFREFLQEQAGAVYSPAERDRLKKTAARILERAGQIENAAELFIGAAAWDGLARLILASARSLTAQGRGQTLGEWLHRIPEEMKENMPWLLYWEALCGMPYDLRKSRVLFERAYDVFKRKRDTAGMCLSWSAIITTFVYEWSDFTPLDRWITEMDDLLRQLPEFPSPEIAAHVTAGMFCALMYRQPHHPDLPRWQERITDVILASPDPHLKMTLGNHLIFYHTWWSGEQAKAAWLIQSLRSQAQDSSSDALPAIVWRAIMAAYYWMTGENADCLRVVREGLTKAEESGVHLWDFMLRAQASFGTLSSGDIESGSENLRAMEFIWATDRRLDISHYHYHLGWEAMCLGRFSLAQEQMETAARIAGEVGVPFIQSFARMGIAEALIEQGGYREAHDILRSVRAVGVAMQSMTIEYQNLWLEAYRCLKQGDSKGTKDYLKKHLAVSREYGIMNHACWRASVMVPLYAIALEEGIECEHVRNVIRKRRLLPDPIFPILDAWPWPYRFSTMGAFRIEKDDKPIALPAKTPKKPLELLKALIAFGGSDVSEERITDALWPDAAGDAAHSAFTTTLQRLRKLLADDKVIIVQDGGVSLDRRYVWVDAWAFERLLESSEFEVRNMEQAPPLRDVRNGNTVALVQNKHEILQRLEKALKLYSGHFLAGDGDKPWAISMRERLRSKYLRAVAMLGRIHEEAGKHAKAAAVYQQGLDVDDLAEEFYQRLMECHHRMGRRAEAMRVYERCKKTLKAALGVEPGEETRRSMECGVRSAE